MTTKFDMYCDKLDLTDQLGHLTDSILIKNKNLVTGQNIYINTNDRTDLNLIKFLYLVYDKCDAGQHHIVMPDFNLIGATVYDDLNDSKQSIVNLLKFLISCDFTKEKYAEVLSDLIRRSDSDTIVCNVVIPNYNYNEENDMVTVELVNTFDVRQTLVLLYRSLFSKITSSEKSYKLLDHEINTIPEYTNILNMKYLSEALKKAEFKDSSDIKNMLDLGYYLWFMYLECADSNDYMEIDISCFRIGTFSMHLSSEGTKCSLSNLVDIDMYLDILKAFYKDVSNNKKVPSNFR